MVNAKRSNLYRMLIHRVVAYPFLTPAILGFVATNNTRCLDIFYKVRSIFHGIPLRRGLRMAKYGGAIMIFPSSKDPFFDDVWLREVYYPYSPCRDDVVIDVGAHMGFFTLKICRKVKEVYAFEPDPINFKFLLANIRCNNLLNVKAFNQAIGDRNCETFLERQFGYGRTRITANNSGIKVKMRTLDSVVKEFGIVPTTIKIDVEGYEMNVLKGAKRIMTIFKPKLVIAAYHYLTEAKDVIYFLSRLGYKCYLYYVPLALQLIKETYIYAE